MRIIYFFALVSVFFACNKTVEPGTDIAPYTWSGTDVNGGNWKTILLSSATEFGVNAPEATTSAAYQDELQALRALSANLNDEQRATIEHWGANGLVRWNQLAQTLAAKYNLPPVANADGTYPVPSQANPGVYPLFPFANPVYSARMYAYWGAAQFDALIATWHFKQLYNRPAPYLTATDIITALPRQNVPSYPCEDAVMAAVSRDILTFMFPLEADYLAEQYEQHCNSRKWAGMNTESDLVAGETLGKAVAAKFIARAKNDNMKNSVGNAAEWDSLASAAQTRFGWAWESQESPKRPPMLPFYGQVKPWCIPNVETVRPSAPPALNSPEFAAAVEELKDLSNNLTAEQRRIANFWGDGVSTYTPPGHWNRTAGELCIEVGLNPLRTARVYAYVNMALMDAGISCWDTKTYFFYPRPSQAIPGFKSLLGLPNFPSYTSGHSTFSAAAATVLGHIFPNKVNLLEQQAKEASESRIYGGIHYRFDCEVGLQVGKNIGQYTRAVAEADGAE
jgi:PAP2 superfamily